jgi:hypothetical protein
MIKFRDTNSSDISQLTDWIARDACQQHNGVPVDFWVPALSENGSPKDQFTKCLAIYDDEGVIFYLKLENVMRAFIQFPPDSERDKNRTSVGLKHAFFAVASGARKMGYKEIIFDSKSDGLINMFTSPKFGFKPAEDNFLVRL